jgi:hypothetical protein
MSVHFPSPALLLAGSFALALAGCDALLPVTSTPIPEQPNYGQLPGPGTYTVVAAVAADIEPPGGTAPDTGASATNGTSAVDGAPAAGGTKGADAATADRAAGTEAAGARPATTAPPVNDADGAATGFWAKRTGADTLAVAPMPADDAAAVQAALARAMERRGYRARPGERAAWRLSYRATVENREENLAPRDKLLVPRMRCDQFGCSIQQQWEHFGPPLRGDTLRRYQVGVVQVQIHNARNGTLVWQGRLSSELDENGQLSRNALFDAASRMMKQLPRAPKHNPLPEPQPESASRR